MLEHPIAVCSWPAGNAVAFQAAIDDAKAQGCQAVCVLGGIVGSGPQPNECVEIAHQCDLVLRGWKDDLALEPDRWASSDKHGGRLNDWTHTQLSAETREWLRSLPETASRWGIHFTTVGDRSGPPNASADLIVGYAHGVSGPPQHQRADLEEWVPWYGEGEVLEWPDTSDGGRVHPGAVYVPDDFGAAWYLIVRPHQIEARRVTYDGRPVLQAFQALGILDTRYLDYMSRSLVTVQAETRQTPSD